MTNGTTSEQAIESMIKATMDRKIHWESFPLYKPNEMDPRYGVEEAYSAEYEGLRVILYRIRTNFRATLFRPSYLESSKPFQETILDIKDATGGAWRIPYTPRLDELLQAVRGYLGTAYPPQNVLEKLAKTSIPPPSHNLGLAAR